MLRYPSVDEVVKTYDVNYLAYGSHNIFSVNISGENLVYKESLSKSLKKNIRSILKKIENPLFLSLLEKNHFTNYRFDVGRDYGKLLSIESLILDKWSKHNIPCTTILEKHKDALIYKKIDSINYFYLMSNYNNCRKEYTQLVELISLIRKTAKDNNDTQMLHSDMLPKNFLYDKNKKIPIAIDPGIILKPASLEKSDAQINLSYLYSLINFNDHKFYLDTFLDTLNIEEKKTLFKMNRYLPADLKLYVEIRSKILSLVKKNYINPLSTYSKQNIDYINNAILKH